MTNTVKEEVFITSSFEASMRGINLPVLNKGKIADSVPEIPQKIFGEGRARYPESVRKIYGSGAPKVFIPDSMIFAVHMEHFTERFVPYGLLATRLNSPVIKHFTDAGFDVLESKIRNTANGVNLEIKVALDEEGLKRAAKDPEHASVQKNKQLITTAAALATTLRTQYPSL